jgi:uncharacterized Zn finger protein
VEPALQEGNYEKATGRLKSTRGLMERMGQSREFAAYLGSVRVAHKRKRNFMKLLVGAGLV